MHLLASTQDFSIMYLQIFSDFRDPSRLPKLETIISDPVKPRSAEEKEILETTVKLFYKPEHQSSLAGFERIRQTSAEMVERGFTLIDSNPFTVIMTTRQKYKRSLKKVLSPEEFIQERASYPDLEVIFNNGLFEVYENIPDGLEKIETKHYYNDRLIFRLN